MAIGLHHIYVCCSAGAPEARALLDAGFIEGSSNIHEGQGTANRRFFFESGYLELFWVHDEREARSDLTGPTRLWDRWAGRGSSANPFGICLSSPEGVDSPFPTRPYRPNYLPDGRCLLFADEMPLSEPEVFMLSWPQARTAPVTEPKQHRLGLRELKSVSIGLRDADSASRTLKALENAGLLQIHSSPRPELIIEFDAEREVRHDFVSLGLRLIGRPSGFK